MRIRAILVVLAVGAAFVAPAFADSTVVSVNTSSTGTRQLSVLDLTGHALSSVSLTPSKGQPFQVRVVDSNFSNIANGSAFDVTAVMNNLYSYDGTNYDYSKFIPSGDLRIDYLASGAVRAFDPVANVLGALSLSGTLPTCAAAKSLSSTLNTLLSSLSGLGLTLCTELGVVGQTVSSVGPVTLPTATGPLSLDSLGLSDLPFQLGLTPETGAFTGADYSVGSIGANDPAAPANWATNVTGRKVLHGQAGLTTTLANTLKTAVQTAINANPLTSATGAGAVLPVNSVLSALANSGTAALTTLAGTLSQVSAADAAAIVNSLTGTAGLPALGDLSGVGGTYASFPVLSDTGATPVAKGRYQGTMTITLVQQ